MTAIRKKKILPKYQPHDRVYAIAFSSDSEENKEIKSDLWEANFAKIFKVYIKSINIDSDGVSYWVGPDLELPSEDWGDSVKEDQLSPKFEDLIKYLKRRWKL